MELTLELEVLKRWIGKTETKSDMIGSREARLMQATLDQTPDLSTGAPLPPLWHWLYFPTEAKLSELGNDGHPARGGFLPPIALPKRMWAGGRLRFECPLRIGQDVEKTSSVQSVERKTGRSGDLCFVTVRHELTVSGKICLTEEHDIVYRGESAATHTDPQKPAPNKPAPNKPAPNKPAPNKPAPVDETATLTISPDPILLFRYSALTFNGHRIHYDADFCRDDEGYDGLVMHGPLIATLLAGLAQRQLKRPLRSFGFRAQNPLLSGQSCDLCFRPDGATAGDVWARSAGGALAMSARAGI